MQQRSPTAEEQLDFLGKLKRLLSEGRFTSTYKFALLIALTNIAVEQGDDTSDELRIDLDDVARQYLALARSTHLRLKSEPLDASPTSAVIEGQRSMLREGRKRSIGAKKTRGG